MKSIFHAAAFVAAASAAVLRREQCCFQITASGGVSGVLGQLSDGQNRINGSYPAATYCLNNGVMISNGKTCLVTLDNDATHQFQCDEHPESAPLSPTTGWSSASNGSLLFQGSDQFYACPATDTEYNVYTQTLRGQEKCRAVKLTTNSNGTCSGLSPSGGLPASSVPANGYSVLPSGSTPVGPAAESATPYTASQGHNTAVAYSSYGAASYSTPSQSIPISHGTAPVYSASSLPVVPAYESQSASSYESAGQSVAPTYSSASRPVVPVVTGYSSASASSVSAYTPEAIMPSGLASQPSAPGYVSTSAATVPAYTAQTEVTSAAIVPSYNTETVPTSGAVTETTAATVPVVPAYSQASSASSVQTVAVYSSASQPSIPAYSSASTLVETAPVISTPAQTTPLGETTSIETAPVAESTPSTSNSYSHHINSFTPSLLTSTVVKTTSCEETSPAESTPVESTPAETTSSSAVFYPAASSSTISSVVTSVQTHSVETTPVTISTLVISTTAPASVPSYTAQSESIPAGTTVTEETTFYTTYCPVTETTGGSTAVYSTWSTITSVNRPSTVYAIESTSSPAVPFTYVGSNTSSAPLGTAPAGYGIPSASTETVYTSTTSAILSASETSPAGYGTTSSVATSLATTPGYGSSTSEATFAVTTSAASSTTPATSTSATACQTELSGAYQTPHLIEWVSKEYPDTAYGTQYNASVDSDCSTIFNFDIPDSYAGKTCSVIFLFPEEQDLETSAYTFSGSGELVFEQLSGIASESTTYNTAPSVNSTLNSIAIQPGNSYVVATTACNAGTTESIELSSAGGLELEFFEDWNPSSLGLYVTAC